MTNEQLLALLNHANRMLLILEEAISEDPMQDYAKLKRALALTLHGQEVDPSSLRAEIGTKTIMGRLPKPDWVQLKVMELRAGAKLVAFDEAVPVPAMVCDSIANKLEALYK